MHTIVIDKSPILDLAVCYHKTSKAIESIAIINHDRPRLLNNIYCGKVVTVSNGMEGAFVDIGLSENAFIQRNDLLRAFGIKPSAVLGQPLSKLVKCGQMILVQIEKEPYQLKGAQVTTDIAIAGNYVVFMPYMKGVKYSRKAMADYDILALEIELNQHLSPYGVIIRSAAINDQVASHLIVEETQSLIKKWATLVKHSKLLTTAKCLYYAQPFEEIITGWCRMFEVDTIDLTDMDLKNALIENGIDKTCINLVKSKGALFQAHGIDVEGFMSKTQFISTEGVSVTINELEAFTVVDVNSAKYKMIASKRLEVFKVNDIASKIIFKHLMVQQISGIVLIDFIDMTETEQQSFMNHLAVEGYNKSNNIYMEGFTRLGLLELTKKREMPSIKDLLSFDFQQNDLLYWTLYQLYLELQRLTIHTNTKQVTLELESPLYIYLMQNRPFDAFDLSIKYKHSQGRQKSYKIHTEKH